MAAGRPPPHAGNSCSGSSTRRLPIGANARKAWRICRKLGITLDVKPSDREDLRLTLLLFAMLALGAVAATEIGWWLTGDIPAVRPQRVALAAALFVVCTLAALSAPRRGRDYLPARLRSSDRSHLRQTLEAAGLTAALLASFLGAVVITACLGAVLCIGNVLASAPWWLLGVARTDALPMREFLLGGAALVLAFQLRPRPAFAWGRNVVRIPGISFWHDMGPLFLARGRMGELIRVDAASGETVHSVPTNAPQHVTYGVSPDGSRGLGWEDREERLWVVDTMTGVATVAWEWQPGRPRIRTHPLSFRLVVTDEFSGRLLALCTTASGEELGLRRVEIDVRKPPDEMVVIHDDPWNDEFLAESGDLQRVYLGARHWTLMQFRKQGCDWLYAFDFESAAPRLVRRAPSIQWCAVSAGGLCAFVQGKGREREVVLYDLECGRERFLARGRHDFVDVSENGRCVIVCGNGGDAMLGQEHDDFRLRPVHGLLSGGAFTVLDCASVLAAYQGDPTLYLARPG